jgi:RNA polymerase sigma-70 factor (ECF subfamily)
MTSFAHALQADMPVLSTIARRLCGNRHDADDLVQDTIERALRAGDSYSEHGTRLGWLATILRNRFRDSYRMTRRQATPTGEPDVHAAPEPAAVAAWEHITAGQVAEAIAQLPQPFRRVYELHAGGHAYTAIADELGIPVSTVGTRLARARGRLKVILNAKVGVC